MKRLAVIICIVVCLSCGAILAYYGLVQKEQTSTIDDVESVDNTEEITDDVISKYNNPYVPQGFEKLETDTASWQEDENGNPKGYNSGLVIVDKVGNEFVWVPVKTLKIDEDIKSYFTQEELVANDREKEQLKKYGGFYIARYEAGIEIESDEYSEATNNIEGVPVSKKNAIPWNYIQLKYAKSSAQNMYKENELVDSDLPTVLQYAFILQWLKATGIDIYTSTNGNFSNTVFDYTGYSTKDLKTYTYVENGTKLRGDEIVSSGASEYTKLNNIYDLAGNLSEFADTYIEEKDNATGGYPSMGGRYNNYTSNILIPSAFLGDKSPLSIFGFRVVLYNK